jgi:hypothetical protein
MEPKQILSAQLHTKTNQIPGTFSSKMSGGADVRPESLTYGFAGDSVSPGKAIFAGGKRSKRRHNSKKNKTRRSNNNRKNKSRRPRR